MVFILTPINNYTPQIILQPFVSETISSLCDKGNIVAIILATLVLLQLMRLMLSLCIMHDFIHLYIIHHVGIISLIFK